MYRLAKGVKQNPVRRWNLPDRAFFAAGACHILAYAFLERYPEAGFAPLWIKPAPGHTGNHIIIVREDRAFDYHGHSDRSALLAHYCAKGQSLVAGLVLRPRANTPGRTGVRGQVAQLRRLVAARAKTVPARRAAPRAAVP